MSDGLSVKEHGLRTQRGVVTGNNSAFVLVDVHRKLGDLALIRAEGYADAVKPSAFEYVVEESAVAPLIRGADVRPNRAECSRFILCRTSRSARTLPRAAKYAELHNARLPHFNNSDFKVVWHDLASDLHAAVVAPDVVLLNTVYFISSSEANAHQLARIFNSLPMRVFARCIAERAKDAHFRFFGWTIDRLPLPADWAKLHIKSTEDVDGVIAHAFGLSRSDMRVLGDFDQWLRS